MRKISMLMPISEGDSAEVAFTGMGSLRVNFIQ